MIDWFNVAGNGLWILGCAIGLAALSYASWEASLSGERFTARLRRPGIMAFLYLAGLLFSLGLAATSGRTLETILWLALGAGFGVQLVIPLWKR
jgi:hypothetical protein